MQTFKAVYLLFQFNMSSSDYESDVDKDWLASINWPKRVDPTDRQKLLLFQYMETYELIDRLFFSFKGSSAKMKHLVAWKKVWKYGLR